MIRARINKFHSGEREVGNRGGAEGLGRRELGGATGLAQHLQAVESR